MRHQKGVAPLLLVLILGLMLALGAGGVAFAHGERAQEGFLRLKTAAWQDVQFSTDKVKQGEKVVITGKVKLLEVWPGTLDPPETGYLNVSASGPHFILKDRVVNGHEAPASFVVGKGGEYEFKMVLEGRTPGYWHVHPTIYVHHTGGLVGPGQWITVEAAPGGYKNMVTLMNGTSIDLDKYGFRWVFWFSSAGFILGMWWMVWWTLPPALGGWHRTVTNVAVTLAIPVNDPGEDIGLITKADHKTSTLIMVLTLVLLAVGWVVMEMNWPVRLPQQVLRFTPEQLAQPAKFAQASTRKALYNVDTDTVVLEGSATNIGSQPMRVVAVNAANMTFEQGKQLVVDPAVVQPGQTVAIKMTIKDEAWREQRLLPLGRSEMGIGGLLIFESGGVRNAITIEAPVTPNKFTYGRG